MLSPLSTTGRWYTYIISYIYIYIYIDRSIVCLDKMRSSGLMKKLSMSAARLGIRFSPNTFWRGAFVVTYGTNTKPNTLSWDTAIYQVFPNRYSGWHRWEPTLARFCLRVTFFSFFFTFMVTEGRILWVLETFRLLSWSKVSMTKHFPQPSSHQEPWWAGKLVLSASKNRVKRRESFLARGYCVVPKKLAPGKSENVSYTPLSGVLKKLALEACRIDNSIFLNKNIDNTLKKRNVSMMWPDITFVTQNLRWCNFMSSW